MSPDSYRLLGFAIFAFAFVASLTLIVRLAKLHVRARLDYTRGLGLTAIFVFCLLAVWWFLTRGSPGDRIVQPLILPSPLEVLKAFKPLHFEQGLVISAFSSWLRVTDGLALATIVAVPLGVLMATFSSVAVFFLQLALTVASMTFWMIFQYSNYV